MTKKKSTCPTITVTSLPGTYSTFCRTCKSYSTVGSNTNSLQNNNKWTHGGPPWVTSPWTPVKDTQHLLVSQICGRCLDNPVSTCPCASRREHWQAGGHSLILRERPGLEPTVRIDICESAAFYQLSSVFYQRVASPQIVKCFYGKVGKTLRSHKRQVLTVG